jgi:hypothetical protein
MENTELTREETTFEYKPGGWNRWSDNGTTEQAFKPLFADEEAVDDQTDEEQEDTTEEQNLGGDSVEVGDDNEPSADDTTEDQTEDIEVDNPAYFFAQQLVADGIVDLEEVGKDISFNDIYNNYKERLEPTIKNEVLSEVNQTLQQAGITEENIVMLQAIQNGIPVDELYTISRYEKYGQLSVDDDQDRKIEVIKEWYALRNLKPKEIERNLNAIEIDDEVDSEFEQAKDFFKGAVDNFKEEQKNITLENLRQEQAIRQYNQAIIDNAIKLGKIGEEKLTSEQSKQLEADLYKKTETVDLGGGQVIAASPFEIFMYHMNNNLEFQLLQYKNFRYKDVTQAIEKEKAKEETTKDFLSALQKQQTRSSLKTSIKRNETTESVKDGRTSTGGIRYEI